MQGNIIEFLRKRDYRMIKELGNGACGKTVLLYDQMIDEHFVCKKYSPFSDTYKKELFTNFVREIKLLHLVFHPNIVRVFNYYLYPDRLAGYILMEYIQGTNIFDFLRSSPEKISDVFLQSISGFRYLETNKILHRDIRAGNLMVREDGVLKIIDLGFGKQIQTPEDFDNSVSLVWWCELPDEFGKKIYDFRSEIYFIGKLFERIIQENQIEDFKYNNILNQMCNKDPNRRIQSFADIEKEIQNDEFESFDFQEEEMQCYRNFADFIVSAIVKIENGTRYCDDVDLIQRNLEKVYIRCNLEKLVRKPTDIISCFFYGSYYYQNGVQLKIQVLRSFLNLFKRSSLAKKRIILADLHTRIDALDRYEDNTIGEDDIPF